ncbi:hypothetical protein [Ruminococcus sp.]|uniref:hypothetical protein n=1 Tax=Ruminococcus sp. TaxID=41978 RepID=UPI00352113AB
MQGIFRKENTDKALKYGIYRHLPTYEKIIRNLVSFLLKNMSQEVDEISGKEIFVVAQKQNSLSLLSRNTFLMPQTWKK